MSIEPRPVPGGEQFPFSAVVGQDDLRLALLLAAIDPRIGGVLLRGEKGQREDDDGSRPRVACSREKHRSWRSPSARPRTVSSVLSTSRAALLRR